MKAPRFAAGKILLLFFFVVLVGGVVAFVTFGSDTVLSWFEKKEAKKAAPKETKIAAELVRDQSGRPVFPPALRLTPRIATSLGISQATIVQAVFPRNLRSLPPQMGILAYDSERLFAVRSRFPGEVSEIANARPDQRGSIPLRPSARLSTSEETPSTSGPRPLAVGDRVKKGDLMAVVWSRDLGDKKAALIDAMIDWRRDSAKLKDLEALYLEGAVGAASYNEAQRTVQKDLNARNSAERTLRMWKLDDEEIAALKKEAETIEEAKRDPKKEKDWARVEVRAPSDGVIVEKNTHLNDWADPANYATPMFRIADLRKLQVWLNPAEEYLPILQEFLNKPDATPLTWDIFLQAEPKAPPLTGVLLRLAPSLEPNQHTVLVVGLVDNPQGKLLIGQFVTAIIHVPIEPGLVELPTTALNEEKGQSVVFVQEDHEKLEFTMRPVSVVYRFKDVVYVRSTLPKDHTAEVSPGKLPLRSLEAGELVVTESVLELTKALRDLRAKEELARHKQLKK
jgi:cobalt-zinc-cadmium efflux system membrane fusion protein